MKEASHKTDKNGHKTYKPGHSVGFGSWLNIKIKQTYNHPLTYSLLDFNLNIKPPILTSYNKKDSYLYLLSSEMPLP